LPGHFAGGQELFANEEQCSMTGLKQPSDEELYRRMRKGDQAALAMLYERRQGPLYRYALHMSGNRATAEEVAQDVFLHLLAPGGKFDERLGPLEAYLYGIARNLLRKVRPAANLEEIPERAAEPDMLRNLIADETAAALYGAVRGLPAVYREVVVLCDLEERTYEDAARLMGCPVGTVRSRLHRARALLAAKLRHLKSRAGTGKGVA
jgi:RNA polymerase sigma-70 factor (ECF subfamily)